MNKEKTQTRREHSFKKLVNKNPDHWTAFDVNEDGSVWMENNEGMYLAKPRFKLGEVVYLKESTAEVPYCPSPGIIYLYDLPEYDENGLHRVRDNSARWQNKLFMKSELARYFIKITGVKAERLFSISDDDCIKEGVDRISVYSPVPILGHERIHETEYLDYMSKEPNTFETPQESCFSLFRFANKIPKSREIKNVWVWVYDYVLCDKNGNEI